MAFSIKHPWRKGVCLLVFLYLSAALLTLKGGDRALYPARTDAVPIYIVNNGFHTDIALPAGAVMSRGGLLADAARRSGADVREGKWLVYGWGDAGFFTAQGLSVGRALDGLRALFRPGNPSVIRVFGVSLRPDQAFAGNTASGAVLTPEGFEAMARHMETSFVAENGAPVVAALPTDEVFFVSREHFSILRVCNNWTADQLAAAGLPTAPLLDGNAILLGLDLKLRADIHQAD
ncbi:MAG: DUF2459 domain-containing protein [Asticcacaulis sp.]|uniref:DUF2459 domain-containing protein n=1 Tax=Asticcacaulis sp. TaxID=1872648 RepID=UPI0039E4E098